MDVLEFIKKSPSMFHAINNIKELLLKNNFIELNESDTWCLEKNKNYFFTRNLSTIIAFKMPNDFDDITYNICAAHSDSPTFKIKPNFKLDKSKYSMLNTEIYGGPILNTWLDRPLDIVGKVIIKENNKLVNKLVSFNKPMAIIPNCSIHYYKELNNGVKLDPQLELVPLCADINNDKDLLDLIASKLNINKEDIISHDLYLSLLDRGSYGGFNDEFIFAPQIDNLECSCALIESLINSKNNNHNVNLCAIFESEEIGSHTIAGAGSNILADTLKRISSVVGNNDEKHLISLSKSFVLSADNAQGFHPNYASKYDPTNSVYMNQGIVIKTAARGSYTTNAQSLSYFLEVCNNSKAKYQLNANRSNIPGGSTLGAISLAHVSVMSVDIGLAQIAMHSSMETAGRYDYIELVKAIEMFYKMHIKNKNDLECEYVLD